jgi:hypothetical protein
MRQFFFGVVAENNFQAKQNLRLMAKMLVLVSQIVIRPAFAINDS